ncbi:MAG: transcriptional regulator [Spirochaetia bacterium]
MMKSTIKFKVQDDFSKARTQEFISSMLNILNPQKQELLNLYEVKDLVKPDTEEYQGMKAVPISLIIGSEGRYRDFNKHFLPKHDFLRHRWENIDSAHYKDVILPPIKLYEIGGLYFVRDGNHRVSVARHQGAKAIDAEVSILNTKVTLKPDFTIEDLRETVIAYEREQFFQCTKLDPKTDLPGIEFSSTGMYDEIFEHIQVHKYYINQDRDEEISFKDAAKSWYEHVFVPVREYILNDKVLLRFPGRTCADMYIWIMKHWGELKEKYGEEFPLHQAAEDYSSKYGKSIFQQIKDFLRRIVFGKPE